MLTGILVVVDNDNVDDDEWDLFPRLEKPIGSRNAKNGRILRKDNFINANIKFINGQLIEYLFGKRQANRNRLFNIGIVQ